MTKKVHFTRVNWGCLVALVTLSAVATVPSESVAAGPVQHAHFEPDYEASGFVVPAGMPSPDVYFQSVQQAGFFGNAPIASRLGGVQGGHCDQCDCGPGGCGQGGCGQGGCGHGLFGDAGYVQSGFGNGYEESGFASTGCGHGDCGCGLLGGCRLLSGCRLFGGCGVLGCGRGGCLSRVRGMCLFCGGAGCGVCQSIGRGYLLGALRSLLPYGDAGLSTQRWYDLSADLMFLEVSGGTSNQVITRQGQGLAGAPVLLASDADDADYAVGGRISGAFIFGPGGNLEVTYLGGNRWRGEGVASGAGDLFSFLSVFGTAPFGGTPQTDFSDVQRVASEATFHSGEVNYRRRTVGPYGRFQWSSLGGIRYLRFDSDFHYAAQGGNEFFNFTNSADNEMVGVQSGGDLWWNVIPGVNLGIGMKGGPVGNRIHRRSSVDASSIGAVSNADYISKTVWFREIEATLLYRLSHSWTLKGQYYLFYADRVGYGFDTTVAENVFSNGAVPIEPISTRSLTIDGFSIGAEYIW